MSKSNAAGTKLLIDSVQVAALTSINGVEISADTIDVTDLSNADGYREYLAGFKDPGEVPMAGFLDSADATGQGGQAKMKAALDSGDTVPFEIRFPQKIGLSWTGSGVVTRFSTGAEVEGAVTFEGTLKVSGKPTLAATASGSSGTGN